VCLPLIVIPARSIIWYVALDPLKWLMMYILNEEGVRDRRAWRSVVHTHRPKTKEGKATGMSASMLQG
jgi:hypothetical protein